MSIKVMVYEARLAFPTLGQPEYYQGKKQRENDQRRWSASGIIVPGETKARRCDARGMPVGDMLDAKTLIDAVLLEAAREKWKDKAEAFCKAILRDPKGCCWIDGDLKPQYDSYPGNWILASHRNEGDGRPSVVDQDRSPIYMANGEMYPEKAGRLYSGGYVNLHVEIWPQDNKAGKGLRAGLLGVQRAARTGAAFGGASRPVDDAFGDMTDGAGADDDLA